MRPRGLLLVLLVIMIEYCVAQSSCSTPRFKCRKTGNRFGVSAYCLAKEESKDCTGRFYSGRKYCKDANNCGCCVPKKGSNVNAAFKLSNVIYTETLTNHSSAEYKALAKAVREEVLKIPKFLNFWPEFFRNGSVIDSDGTAYSVIVDSRVITNKEKQKKADNFVKNKLKNSNIPGLVPASVSVGVRLCVAGYESSSACANMKEEIPYLNIICVQARDKYECIQWLNETEVDVVGVEAADIYLAKEMFGEDLSVVASTRDKNMKYDTYENRIVAVVRRSTINGVQSLNGSKFCSTGYGTTSGWFVPLSKQAAKGELECSSNEPVLEANLKAFSSYFGDVCLPGQWGPDKETSDTLKSKYPNLCSLCDDDCMTPSGPQGALKCLTDSTADVAWTNLEAVKNSGVNSEDFGFLCPDGRIVGLESGDDCYWASEPWPGWLIRADETETEVIVSALTSATWKAKNPMKDWAKPVLGIDKPSVIIELDPPLSPYTYLNQGGYYITINNPGCEGVPVKFCVTSDIALQKCRELAQVLKSRRVRPLLTCVKEEDCTLAIVNGIADIVTLDGGDVFTEYSKDQTIPVISEVYGAHDASYFAVAVVRADSGITTLADLKGKDSCHTGIDKTAGWNMPLISLIEDGQVNKDECDYPGQVGGFFKESCAPGALDPKYDPNVTNPPSLCDLCIGNGNGSFICDRNANELYYGYSGAFRCLVDGGGDVAFVKHITVPENTDGQGEQPWNEHLNSSNYRLLCKNGGTVKVEDYENCNLAKVPSHMVVTGYNTGDVLRQDIRTLLLRASETLPPGNDVFVMFGDYGTYHDLLFKNSATSLINLSEVAFDELKNGSYWQALEALKECDE